MTRHERRQEHRQRRQRKRWPGAQLRALRLWADLTQPQLAYEIGASERAVREWERRDDLRIQSFYLDRLDALAQREGFPMLRRDVLAGGMALAAGVVLPDLRPRVDERYLGRLGEVTSALEGAFEAAPSGQLVESARAHLDLLLSLLDRAVNEDVARRLLVLTGNTTLVMGILVGCLGQVQRARLCAEQAVSLAREAGSKGLEARALGDLTRWYSPMRVPNGDPRLAIEHAEPALAATGASTPGDTRSWVAVGLAEACAVRSDNRGMMQALEVAERALTGPATSEDPGAHNFGTWNEAMVRYMTGRCYVLAGRAAEAEVLLRDALANGMAQNDRHLVLIQADLASAQAQQRKPEQACGTLASAHESVLRDGYVLGMQRIVTTRRYLDPYSHLPCVRELDERLRLT